TACPASQGDADGGRADPGRYPGILYCYCLYAEISGEYGRDFQGGRYPDYVYGVIGFCFVTARFRCGFRPYWSSAPADFFWDSRCSDDRSADEGDQYCRFQLGGVRVT